MVEGTAGPNLIFHPHAYCDGRIPPMERPCVQPFAFQALGVAALADVLPPYSANKWPKPGEATTFRSAA